MGRGSAQSIQAGVALPPCVTLRNLRKMATGCSVILWPLLIPQHEGHRSDHRAVSHFEHRKDEKALPGPEHETLEAGWGV